MAFKRYMGFLQNHKLEDNLGGIADCFDSRDDKQTVITGARVLAESGKYKWTYVFDRIDGEIIYTSEKLNKQEAKWKKKNLKRLAI